jgi:hypothetical protein
MVLVASCTLAESTTRGPVLAVGCDVCVRDDAAVLAAAVADKKRPPVPLRARVGPLAFAALGGASAVGDAAKGWLDSGAATVLLRGSHEDVVTFAGVLPRDRLAAEVRFGEGVIGWWSVLWCAADRLLKGGGAKEGGARAGDGGGGGGPPPQNKRFIKT